MGLARIFRTKDETIVIPSLSVVVKFLGFDTTRGAEIGVGAPREDVILRGEKCNDPQFFSYLPAYHTDPRAIEARRLLNEVHCEQYNARHASRT